MRFVSGNGVSVSGTALHAFVNINGFANGIVAADAIVADYKAHFIMFRKLGVGMPGVITGSAAAIAKVPDVVHIIFC